MSGVPERNRLVIDEFRANDGRVGGSFAAIPVLLLHTSPSKTGENWVHPLTYRSRGHDWIVVASKSGADTNPSWFDNLLRNPSVTIEIGTDTIPVTALVPTGTEREDLWAEQKQHDPRFGDYEAVTDRAIPVIVLRRRE